MSANPNSDLVSAFRTGVANFFNALESFHAHLEEKNDRNLTFAAGDMQGANSGITFGTLNQAISDFTVIYNAVHAGGTIAVGQWANVIKIK